MLNISILTLLVTACQVEISPVVDNLNPESTISGSVGDGPIIQAQITVTDSYGFTLGNAVSDINASYSISVPQGTTYPVVVKATGGIDVVTNTAPDFSMISVALDPSANTVNINPYSTLIVKIAQSMSGGLTAANLSMANQYVIKQLNFGLDPVLVPNPISTPINEANVSVIIKSSEALGEAIRRTRDVLSISGSYLTEDEIIDTIASDMSDGALDGHGPVANARIAATTNIVMGQVLIEALGNHLFVGGTDATSRMDAAINLSVPSAIMTTADVVINEEMLSQARVAIAAAATHTPDSKLATVAAILAGLSGNIMASDVNAVLPVDANSVLNEVISQLPLSTNSDFEAINTSVGAANKVMPSVSAPGVFEYSLASYSVGESDGAVNITINRVGGSDGVATVEWKTKGGSATFSEDYGNFGWTVLTFDHGETSKTQAITINPDDVAEGDETFSVLLQNPTGGAILGAKSIANITIFDDDTNTSSTTVIPTEPAPSSPAPTTSNGAMEDLVNQVVGFGQNTTGGRGGELCTVTSLANNGTGTLRNCLESIDPKWIRFNVSGVIDLAASRISAKSNKTVDGRGANITIRNGGIDLVGIENVIIHNVKFTDQSFFIGGTDNQPIGIPYLNILRDTKNIWIDHVTFSNNEDDPIQIGNPSSTQSPRNITVSWCRWEGNVNKAMAIGFDPTKSPNDINITATLHHNFFNDSRQRHPRVSQAKVHTFNNYVYHWHSQAAASLAVQNAEIYSENNIYEAGGSKDALGAAISGHGVTEAGFTRSEGDLLLTGALIQERLPSNVFVPASYYTYTAETANSNLKTKIINEAGWRNVSAP